MATKVRHGATPKFGVRLQRGSYGLTLKNYYTVRDGLTCGGVTAFKFNSNRDIKRRAELLGMRTVFLAWYMEYWLRTGNSWASGVREITQYPWRRLYKRLKKYRGQVVRRQSPNYKVWR